MNEAYNFLGSWQVIPEKCIYEDGIPPKSMLLKIEEQNEKLVLQWDWLTHDNQTLNTGYSIGAYNNDNIPFDYKEVAETISTSYSGSHDLQLKALNTKEDAVFELKLSINNKGQLILTQTGATNKGKQVTKTEVYHKQLSVLPYAYSVSGVAIVPTQQGVIKHKALQAMAEQTDMHLDQIRKQIELLAVQANQIKRRKELSMTIYGASINFVPQIGQTYHLYKKHNDTYTLSLVAPIEWGGGAGPHKEFMGSVKLLADHTWTEVDDVEIHL